MGEHWLAEEIALACKAYIISTQNAARGADQNISGFNNDFLAKYEAVSPTGCE